MSGKLHGAIAIFAIFIHCFLILCAAASWIALLIWTDNPLVALLGIFALISAAVAAVAYFAGDH